MAKRKVVEELESRVIRLESLIEDLLETIDCLDNMEPVVITKPGRKDEVLQCFEGGKHLSVPQIARMVGINERNVSSQLTYLRKDGHKIGTDSKGFKFIER
jgi:biotin operon repressor